MLLRHLYRIDFGFHANIVEEYILLAFILHAMVALRCTWDSSINYAAASGKLNLAIYGVTLLTFMMLHLFQFRFDVTHMYKLCPPSHLINFGTALDLSLDLFWIGWEVCTTAEVRDIYRMEFEVFLSLGWVLFYLSVIWSDRSLILIRTLIGCAGATFVTNQFWCSLMFVPNVVGMANATAACWGNLGGGVTQIFIVWCLVKPFDAMGMDRSAA